MQDFDIENHQQLRAYLVSKGYLNEDEAAVIQNLAGGVSNRTVFVQRQSGEAWVIKQALQKLRVAVDWFSDPQRIHQEALGLRYLPEFVPEKTIPDLIFEDESQNVLAMAAVPMPHHNWKTLLLAKHPQQHHIVQFGQILGGIHRGAYLQRSRIQPVFADQVFFETLRLEPYYLYTAEQQPSAREFLHTLVHRTRENIHTLVHGDYSPKNILVYQDQLILLDHEVIHFGDPAFDLGFSLTHLLSKAHHLVEERAAFGAAALTYWQTYLESVGDVPWRAGLEDRAVKHTLACLLARVSGRSQLEYLSPDEKHTQRHLVLSLISSQPAALTDLIDAFIERI